MCVELCGPRRSLKSSESCLRPHVRRLTCDLLAPLLLRTHVTAVRDYERSVSASVECHLFGEPSRTTILMPHLSRASGTSASFRFCTRSLSVSSASPLGDYLQSSRLKASLEEVSFAGWIRKHKDAPAKLQEALIHSRVLLRFGFGVEAERGGVDAVALPCRGGSVVE